MAHVETIMTSASLEEAVEVLCKSPEFTFPGQRSMATALEFNGDLVDVEGTRDEEGSFNGLTTAIDVYGPTDADARERAEILFNTLKGYNLFNLGMHPDDDDNYRLHSYPSAE